MANKRFVITVMGTPGSDTTPLAAFIIQLLRSQNIIVGMTGKDSDGEDRLMRMVSDDMTISKALKEIATSHLGPIEDQIQIGVVDSPTNLVLSDDVEDEEE